MVHDSCRRWRYGTAPLQALTRLTTPTAARPPPPHNKSESIAMSSRLFKQALLAPRRKNGPGSSGEAKDTDGTPAPGGRDLRSSIKSRAGDDLRSLIKPKAENGGALIGQDGKLTATVFLSTYFRCEITFSPVIRTYKFSPSSWDLRGIINTHCIPADVLDMRVLQDAKVLVDFKVAAGSAS